MEKVRETDRDRDRESLTEKRKEEKERGSKRDLTKGFDVFCF